MSKSLLVEYAELIEELDAGVVKENLN